MSNAFGRCARACGGAFLRREGGTGGLEGLALGAAPFFWIHGKPETESVGAPTY